MEWATSFLDESIRFVGQWPELLNILAALVGALASISVASLLRGANAPQRTDRAIGRLRATIAEKQRVVDNPTLHATIVDRQNIVFSLFTLFSGALFYGLEDGKFDSFTPWGLPVALFLTAVAFATTMFALVTLASKWVWSRPFIDFESWKERQQKKIDTLQRRDMGKRTTLIPSDTEAREYQDLLVVDFESWKERQKQQSEALQRRDMGERVTLSPSDIEARGYQHVPKQEDVVPEISEEQPLVDAPSSLAGDTDVGIPEKAGDRFGTFLNSRRDVRLVLAPHLDDKKGSRPWKIGTVKRVGEAGYGFLTERVSSAERRNSSREGGEFYFNFSNVCNSALPEEGDDAFFITVDAASKDGRKPPAYLVCVRDKPCRAIVRTVFANRKAGFAEITDGSNNFASVLARVAFDPQSDEATMEVGDLVSGRVSHNNLGLMLVDVRPVD